MAALTPLMACWGQYGHVGLTNILTCLSESMRWITFKDCSLNWLFPRPIRIKISRNVRASSPIGAPSHLIEYCSGAITSVGEWVTFHFWASSWFRSYSRSVIFSLSWRKARITSRLAWVKTSSCPLAVNRKSGISLGNWSKVFFNCWR